LLWVAHMSYFHGVANKGIDPELFHTLVLVRNLLVVAVCVAVIVEIYRPDLDLVRRSHRDDSDGTDPLAGVLAGPRADRSDAGGPSAAGASGGGTAAAGPYGGGAAGYHSHTRRCPASRSRAVKPPADSPLE